MRDKLLALDIGTTAVKSGVFSPDGDLHGLSYVEYPLVRPAPNQVEQDAVLWWKLAVQTARGALAESRVDPAEVVAIAVSAQGITFVPVSADGTPLAPALSWLDTRADVQAKRVRSLYRDEASAVRHLGIHPLPTYTLPKVLWLKDNRPDIFARADRFCTALDFMNEKLAGQFAVDFSVAGGTLMHDIGNLTWAEGLLEELGIPIGKLPRLGWAGAMIGGLLPQAAEALGLPEGVPVILGGHDQECAALGAGVGEGETSISMGTASILIQPLAAQVFDPSLRIPCYPHVEKNRFVLEAVVSAAGVTFRWLRDLLNEMPGEAKGEGMTYELLSDMAGTSQPGANGLMFFPHLSGATSPHWIGSATGMIHGLTLATHLNDVVRSLLEGWCYQIKANLEAIEELGAVSRRIVVFGGGARNLFLCQLLSNILGRTIHIAATTETALVGAAMLAAVGVGIQRDFNSAREAVRKEAREIETQPSARDRYAGLYAQYCAMESQLLDLYSS